MSSRLAKRIENDDFVILNTNTFDITTIIKSKKLIVSLSSEGMIKGSFDDSYWMLFSGVNWVGIKFDIDQKRYLNNIGKRLGISLDSITLMLKCFVAYSYGVYVAKGISDNTKIIKRFLESFGESTYTIFRPDEEVILDFLTFINVPAKEIKSIVASIKKVPAPKSAIRKLSPLINYLVIDNEITKLYSEEIDDETFKKWFPIFFWTKVTFILPLRVMEMMVTPRNCIERRGKDVYLTIRRTQLKKRKKNIGYDVKKDYKKFQYRIPDDLTARTIEKYIELTHDQKRKYLFKFKPSIMHNNMVSPTSFNHLIALFMKERMIGNPEYDYVRHATGIEEFEFVTAGDSRPIAMVNIYFSNLGADVCMQLADHERLSTSEGYYSNIDEIIRGSSIIQVQNEYNRIARENHYRPVNYMPMTSRKGCSSYKRLLDPEDLDDCELYGHYDECIGCKFYSPTEKELKEYEEREAARLKTSSEKMVKLLNGILKAKDCENTVEELFFSAQKAAIRYKEASDIEAKWEFEKWEKSNHTQKIC